MCECVYVWPIHGTTGKEKLFLPFYFKVNLGNNKGVVTHYNTNHVLHDFQMGWYWEKES